MVFSLFSAFNWLSPKDAGSHRIAHDVPFGPDPRHKLDIYAPKHMPGACPVVFFVYGGSWSDGDRGNYEFAGRALAAQGFVTIIADYRLVPTIEYPAFLDDCVAAFAWVAQHIAQYGGDSSRMALMGHSAGAYNAVMLALHPDYLRKSALINQVRCAVGLSGPYDFFPFDGPISLRVFGATSKREDTQPINHVSATAPPMFLGSGDKDTLVAPRNTKALAARLRSAGVAVEEVHYQRLSHAGPLLVLSRPARRLAPVLRDVAGFLHQHLDATQ